MAKEIAHREYHLPASRLYHVQDEAWFKRLVPKPKTYTHTIPRARRGSGSVLMWCVAGPILTKVFAALNKKIAELDTAIAASKTEGGLSGVALPHLQNKWRKLHSLRTAIVKSVDLASRPAVLGVQGPMVNKAHALPDYATYTVFIHTIDGVPVVFLGDRFGTPDQCAGSKTTKYETPTNLNVLKAQLRTVLKAMRERNDPDYQRVHLRWSWVSFKIKGAQVRKEDAK